MSITAESPAVAAIEPWQLGADELVQAVQEIERDLARLHYRRVQLAAEMDRRQIAATLGASSTEAVLVAAARLAPGEARAVVAATAQLIGDRFTGPRLPVTATALAAGEISNRHAQVIARAICTLPPHVDPADRASAERFLTDQARVHHPTSLIRLGQGLHAALDPDGKLPAEVARARRELSFALDIDGMTVLRARLDPEAAATVRAALDPLAAPRPADASGPDRRTGSRRSADALVDLCDRALGAGTLPRVRAERPQLRVTIPFRVLREGRGSGAGEFGDVVDAATARRLACDAQVLPIVLGSRGEPLDVGHAARTIPSAIRRAVTVRDRGCAFPDCRRLAPWTDVHHVIPWCEGGPTRLDNLVSLCGFHHRLVHDQDWRIEFFDRHPWFHPPGWIGGPPRRNHLRHLPDPGDPETRIADQLTELAASDLPGPPGRHRRPSG